MNAQYIRIAMLAELLLLAPAVSAQTATGQVNGTVTDRSGASIPGATIRLTNEGTNITTQTQTNSTGYYLFLNVQSGSYTLAVEMTGFRSERVSTFNIAVNQAITQNVQMDVGAVSDSITITAEAPLLQQSSSELGSVIAEQAVGDLPLNGRNFMQLLVLTPGAVPVSTSQGSGISATEGGMTGIPGSGLF